MTTKIEEQKIINLSRKYKKEKKLILYACTSDYPVKHEDICLLEIDRLKRKNTVKNKCCWFFWTSSRYIS